jgi:hypothetical protein
VVKETLQLDAAGACLFSYLLKAEPDGATGLVALVLPMLPPIAHPSELPSSASSPFPYLYIEVAMVRIAFGGSHVQQVWEGCHLDPPERRLGKPEVPVEERHTASFLLLLRFLRSCTRRLCVHTRTLVVTYRIPSHTRVSLPKVGKGLSRSSVMPLSGAEGGELTATLASRRDVFSLIQPTNPVRSLYTKAIAQKA